MNAPEYLDFAKTYYSLVEEEFNNSKKLSEEQLLARIPKLIALVNVMEQIRGDGFQDSTKRPHGVGLQDELYELDYSCRRMLRELLDASMSDPATRDKLRSSAERQLLDDYLYYEQS